MKTRHRLFLRLLPLVTCGWVLSACTVVTDPTKASSDVTSSTSERSSSGKATNREERVTVFAAANFDDLKEDMARGQGEHLSSFAVLLGVPREQQPEFFTFTRERFPLVFHSERVTPDEMLETFTRELATHPRFRTLTAAK